MGGCVGTSRRVAPGGEKDDEEQQRAPRIVRRLKVRMPAVAFEELMSGADAADVGRVIVEGCLRGRWEVTDGGVSISSLEIISEETVL